MTEIWSSCSDRISNLPGNVVDNVLCFLPIQDVVRTSILSREWRYKWTTIPELVFDVGWVSDRNKVEDIINQVLLHHRGSIRKFVFDISDFRRFPDVYEWILLLSKHKIQEFNFENWIDPNYVVPAPLFAFQQLRHLTLSCCVFNPPPNCKGLWQLVSLELDNVTFEAAAFENFISQCPLLEELCLTCKFESESLEINVPSLKLFVFQGNCMAICCRKSSNLEKVMLSSRRKIVRNHLVSSSLSTLDKVMCSLPAVLTLCLDWRMLELFAGGYIPKKLPATLLHLKFLSLHINFNEVLEVSCALCLIRSCPNLQTFHTDTLAPKSNDYEAAVELLRAHNSSDCTLNNLRKFVLVHGSGVEPEMEFLKYLLACAPILNKIELNYPYVRDGGDGCGVMVEELKQFPRASPKITVKYQEKRAPGRVSIITSYIE